ncbi:hypothetical protein FS842_005166 [Serendipita sp. 407]|nr:hypothetical protein FS842_005166 [Serendipita sp. 407]
MYDHIFVIYRLRSLNHNRCWRAYIAYRTTGSCSNEIHLYSRVALCDYYGKTVFETFVQPTTVVTDYRTGITGITPEDLAGPGSIPFREAQLRVAELIQDKVLTGYCIWKDLSVLGLAHPNSEVRDVALYVPFRNSLNSLDQIVRLPTMVWNLMGRRMGEGKHSPTEDARAVMDLFRSAEEQWEGYIDRLEWPCYLPPNAYRSCFV